MIWRVSNLEAFRQWREDEEAELEPFLARLRGEDEPSDAMKAGTALHLALQNAQEGECDELVAPGYRFVVECDIALSLPPTRELRAQKDYGGLIVSGCVDAIEGKVVQDHKTTARFEPEWYLPSYQWRLYLDIFGADVFRWNVFEIELTRISREDEEVYSIFGFHPLVQHRYPGMGMDCARLAAEFKAFVAEHLREAA